MTTLDNQIETLKQAFLGSIHKLIKEQVRQALQQVKTQMVPKRIAITKHTTQTSLHVEEPSLLHQLLSPEPRRCIQRGNKKRCKLFTGTDNQLCFKHRNTEVPEPVYSLNSPEAI